MGKYSYRLQFSPYSPIVESDQVVAQKHRHQQILERNASLDFKQLGFNYCFPTDFEILSHVSCSSITCLQAVCFNILSILQKQFYIDGNLCIPNKSLCVVWLTRLNMALNLECLWPKYSKFCLPYPCLCSFKGE